MKKRKLSTLLTLVAILMGLFAISPKSSALDPADPFGPTAMAPDESTISFSIDSDDVSLDVDATDEGAFASASTTFSISTSNLTGYTLWMTPITKDHQDEYTNALIRDNPRAKKVIESIPENTTLSDFPVNSWGIGVSDPDKTPTIFQKIPNDSASIKTTDAPEDENRTKITIGVKADRTLPSGAYSGILEFTAIANPVPYTFSLVYDANGGTSAPEPTTRTVFDQDSLSLTVSDVIPTRANHASGSYTFLGWSENPDAADADIAPNDLIELTAEDTTTVTKTLYAVWQKTYNFRLNFAAGTSDSVTNLPVYQTVTSTGDGIFTIPSSEPKRSSYAFTGYTDGSKTYDLGEKYVIEKSDTASGVITKTLTATWGATTQNFGYTNSIQTYTAPVTGYYKLEVWGASGGKSDHGTSGGLGGYSTGAYYATKGTVFYVATGGAGGPEQGGWNGGGNGSTINSDSAAGGGASHIAIATGVLSSLNSNRSAVLVVAGAGGGAGCSNTYGGGGGGTTGTAAIDSHTEYGGPGGPGTQTSGGAGGTNSGAGSFGQGGHTGLSQAWPGGGGGGGWFGGGAGGNMSGGGGAGGGGSGYINPVLASAATFNASQTFSSPSGGHETGHSGNGYAKISYLGSKL